MFQSLSNLHLQSHEVCFTNVFASFIVLMTLTFTSLVLLGRHILVDTSSTALQIQLHLSRLIMNE